MARPFRPDSCAKLAPRRRGWQPGPPGLSAAAHEIARGVIRLRHPCVAFDERWRRKRVHSSEQHVPIASGIKPC